MKFKCRMCGGIVEVPLRYDQAKGLCDDVLGKFEPFAPAHEPKQIHKCANGNRGIMDLLGLSFFPD
ncbi:MAG: hypothetical protein LIR46_02530 [Bacteroidota bacterium]|nr:hypothetical protein [Bacteroidota bacterium]